jgi:hypothetical protein
MEYNLGYFREKKRPSLSNDENGFCDEDWKGSNSYYNFVDPKALEPLIE